MSEVELFAVQPRVTIDNYASEAADYRGEEIVMARAPAPAGVRASTDV